MNMRLNLILILIVAILIGWFVSQQNGSDNQNGLENLIKKEGTPEYVGNKMTTEVFDLNGKPQYLAQAEEIKRFESTERTEFIKPLLNLFDAQTALKQWQLTAQSAEITKEKLLNLKGNVQLVSLDPLSRLQRIETEQLTVDLNSQDVYTDSVVKSTGMGFTTSGIGLKGNLKQQVATLQKNVKTYIEPTKIRQDEHSSTEEH